MKRAIQNVFGLVAAVVVFAMPLFAFAAPDDGEPPPVAAQANNDFNMDESNFDQWVFQGSGNAEARKKRMDSQLKLKLDELTRVCQITDEQKKKLSLAARGDMKRFFDDVEAVRKKFLAVKNDQNAFQNIWQEISPLQQKQSAGLFGEASLFGKSLRKTLTDEQQALYRVVVEERRRFRYRATIEASLITLSNTVTLRAEQHDALLKLLVEETQPPHIFGQYDNYLVLYRLAKLPAKQIKPLLDERQWKLMQPQLQQGIGLEAHLAQTGVIDAPKQSVTGLLNTMKTIFETASSAKEVARDEAAAANDAPADALKPEQGSKGEAR